MELTAIIVIVTVFVLTLVCLVGDPFGVRETVGHPEATTKAAKTEDNPKISLKSTKKSEEAENGPKQVTAHKKQNKGNSAPHKKNRGKIIPVSVNYHFTRKCNYECGFCFHTAKTSYVAPLEDAKKALARLTEHGMKKLNLSGGEPFLYPDFIGEICKFCKQVLKLESVSIVSNGSKIRKDWFGKWGDYLDILAISVDSFDEDTNIKIGRGKGNHLKQLGNISKWCLEHNIKFKLNSVINRYNWEEDFSQNIQCLEPFRWKCFQVLAVDTENSGPGAIRDCSRFVITDEEFDDFCRRHEHLPCFVPESNRMMKSSYIILDEYLKFLNKGDVYGQTTRSVLEVDDLDELLQETDYEPDIFVERGGEYDWSKQQGPGCASLPSEFEW